MITGLEGIAANFLTTVIIFLVFYYLYFEHKENYLRLWSLSWFFYLIRYLFEIASQNTPDDKWLFFLVQICNILNGYLLLSGTLLFLKKSIKSKWNLAVVLFVIYLILMTSLNTYSDVISIPFYFVIGVIYFWNGVIILKSEEFAGIGQYIAGLSFLCWGLYLINLPLLNLVEISIQFGSTIVSSFALFVAIGMLIAFFQKTKLELAESQNSYSIFVNQSNEGIWRIAFEKPIAMHKEPHEQIDLFYEHGYLADCNDAFIKMYGYNEKDEVINKRFIDFHGGKSQKNIDEQITFINSGYHLSDIETEEVDRYGNKKYFLNNAIGIINDEHVIGVWGTQRDITERKEMINSLIESETRFRELFENAVDSIFLWEITLEWDFGKCIEVNKSALAMFGYSKEKLLSLRLADLDPNYKKKISDELVNKLKNNETISFESIQIKKSGQEIPTEVRGHLIELKNRKVLLTIVRDITIRKEYETALIRAKEEAEKSDKFKTEFLAQISHEIRTPVNSILSFSSLLKEELENVVADDLKDSFKIIERGGKRLIRTIDMLLNLAQVQAGNYEIKYEQFDLIHNVLDNLAIEYYPVAKEKGLTLNFKYNIKKALIYADVFTVEQVFKNLIDNAIKYTNKGGIEVIVENCDGKIYVTVSDTGIGIAKSYLPNLFEPFSQEDTGYTRRFEGNGLGLALVKKYIEINKAEIFITSEKGRGSKFYVTFQNIIQQNT